VELLADRCRRFTAIGAAGFGELHVQVPLAPPPANTVPWAQAAPVHADNLRALMFSREVAVDDVAVYLHAANLARARFNSRALSRSDDFIRALPAVADKLMAVWGAEDATAGGASALDARRRLLESSGARFELLPGVGHWAMYEAPAAINALLLAD
jgi:pimeloyl-ACP methyl ester carboxylesterase